MKEIEIINPYGFIYITTNMIDGRRYIGQKVFDNRWKYYLGSGVHFTRALKKYDRKNFIRNIVAIAYSQKELNELEKQWINNYNAVNDNSFYNIAKGGQYNPWNEKTQEEILEIRKKISNTLKGRKLSEETKKKLKETSSGRKHTEESKLKMSNAQKGKKLSKETIQKILNSRKWYKPSEETKRKIGEKSKGNKYNLGKKHTDKTKQKISEINKGKKISAETRIKMSRAQKGKKHPMYGKKHTEITKTKMSKSHKKMKINVYKKDTNEFVGTYESQKECAKQLGIYSNHISRIINGKRKSAGGYIFKINLTNNYN